MRITTLGLSIRKSVKVGNLRVNFSKSGVGVSTGVKGFRIGAGPRGNYISMGRKGIYYRMNLSKKRRKSTRSTNRESTSSTSQNENDLDLFEVDSADVEEMQDTSAAELLDEIRRKRRTFSLAPLILLAAIPVLIFCFQQSINLWIAGIACVLIYVWFKNLDKIRKTVVLFYDLEDENAQQYNDLYESFENLMQAERIWHIDGESSDNNTRGELAEVSVSRSNIQLSISHPDFISANIDFPCIPVGRQKLYFLPDTILICEDRNVGAVSYKDLYIKLKTIRFIEENRVSSDTKIVDSTWMYVNKDGSPDKRFKDNSELPVVSYGKLHFKSGDGLNECIHVSNPKLSRFFGEMLERYSIEFEMKELH